jgi:ketosteroid isomerase-like protein
VSVEAVGFFVRADGHAYRQHYSIFFKVRDGKLVEAHEYQDTLHQYDLKLEHSSYTPVTP